MNHEPKKMETDDGEAHELCKCPDAPTYLLVSLLSQAPFPSTGSIPCPRISGRKSFHGAS